LDPGRQTVIESQLEVSVGLTRAILEALRSLGIEDTDALPARAGIDAALLEKPEKSRSAAQLGMSERTLQRRLQEEGTSHQEILDKTRRYLARESLRSTRVPLTEVAAQLDFSGPGTFFRACRKWEGMTPGQYRETC
jgi:AraC-like DNA-binding protein